MKVGIIGFGIIGKAVWGMFKDKVETFVYDPVTPIDRMEKTFFCCDAVAAKPYIDDCDIAFVCVPTPHDKYNGLDMSIIEKSVATFDPKLFVICSALQPGTADVLMKKYGKKIVVQPEYFGETINHPLVNLSQQQFLILGGTEEEVTKVIKLYQKVYNANVRIRRVTALEAEVIKLSENRAIAYKVSQCQELYDVCKAADVDYETIRQAVYGDDPRFNLWWTWVYEENRGCNSKCIPKDVYGWHKWATDNGMEPQLTEDLIEYNDKLISDNL